MALSPSVVAGESGRYGAARWQALGTYAQLVVSPARQLPAAQARAQELLADVDRTCSRFRPDSDLARANQAAGRRIRVHPLLARAVQVALDAAARTDGIVDPTLGRSLVALGYDRDLAELADPEEQADLEKGTGPSAVPAPPVPQAWRLVEVDPEGALLVPAGVALDLGATGKAFAADLVAAELAGAGTACVVSLGGDVSIGRPDGDADADAGHDWSVEVAERPGDEVAETVVLDRGGLATSTTVHRRWTHQGSVVHHVLDPRTGRPATTAWRTASVAAASCVEANTASTAALVLGSAAAGWLTAMELPSRLVGQDGDVVYLAGWPAGDGA